MKPLYLNEKVIVSACLLGEYCRYDGQTKEDSELKRWLDNKEVIPFCPEAPVLGTPREAIFVLAEGNSFRLRRSSDKLDVTDLIVSETQKIIDAHPDIKCAILKSKSPSCGCESTPIYNKSGEQIAIGDGLATRLMKKNFYTIRDEKNYHNIFEEKK